MTSSLQIALSMNGIEKLHNLKDACILKKKSIHVLKLDHNKIRGLPDQVFCLFNNINLLDLTHNQISNVYSSAFKGVNSLGIVDLQHNYIHYFVTIHCTTGQIKMSWNKVTKVRVSAKSSLTRLYLRKNLLREMPYLKYRLKKLIEIYLEWNNVSVID